jgi:hypothetical protein
MYVEIKLGGGLKDSHIAIADYDVPEMLAKSFCKIYSLNSNIEEMLTEIVKSNMTANNIPMGTSDMDSSIHFANSSDQINEHDENVDPEDQ